MQASVKNMGKHQNMEMKAAWYEELGPADKVLVIGNMPIPEIRPNEVLVRLYASGINPSDVKKRAGLREKMQFQRIIPHSDGAGIIEQVGCNVSPDRIGQRVWIYNARWKRQFGTAAEFVVLPTALAILLPNNVSFAAGACLGIPAMTAHRCVFSDGSVQGQTLLITGGAGSVGHYAIQLAKWGGAQVITTVSNSEKSQHAKDAGADYILNYREENIVERIKEITNNQGVNRIIDVDFGGNLTINQEIIMLNGCIAAYASEGNPNPKLPFYDLLFKGVTFRLVNVYELPEDARYQAIRDIGIMLESNALKHTVAMQFDLDKIVSAHQAVESSTVIGNVVLTM